MQSSELLLYALITLSMLTTAINTYNLTDISRILTKISSRYINFSNPDDTDITVPRIDQLEERISATSDQMQNYIEEARLDGYRLEERYNLQLKKLSTEQHKFMSWISLGLDISDLRFQRYIPVRVYLSDSDYSTERRVTEAIKKLLEAIDFEIEDDIPARDGSWIKDWFAKSRDAISQPEVTERLGKIERVLELKGLEQPQSEIDKNKAEAVSNLIKSVESIPNTSMVVGSILLVKNTIDGNPIISVKTLTHKEISEIESNPAILLSPREILQYLADASARNQANKTVFGGINYQNNQTDSEPPTGKSVLLGFGGKNLQS